MRIGIIDLDAKLFTKLPFYKQDLEKAYINYIRYHAKRVTEMNILKSKIVE